MPFCLRYAAFSADIGCSSQIECSTISDECDQAAQTWLDCVSQDVSQCLCESDGDPNCEGSYKPSEGPALCISELDTLQTCLNE
jgi:hypothetical protein